VLTYNDLSSMWEPSPIPAVGPSRVLFVDQSGDDATAVRGNASRPFQTIEAAILAAEDYDQIRLGVGGFGIFSDTVSPGPSVQHLSIVGAGVGATYLERGGGSGTNPMINVPSWMKFFEISNLSLQDNSNCAILADGTGGGGNYLIKGLFIRNVNVASQSGGRGLEARFVNRLFIDNLDSTVNVNGFSNNNTTLEIDTCRVIYASNIRWNTGFYINRDLTNPDAPSLLFNFQVDKFTQLSSGGAIVLSGHPNIEFDQTCRVAAVTNNTLDANNGIFAIKFFGTAGTIDLGQYGSGIPDTATQLTLDFSGAKITDYLYVATTNWGGTNRQAVQARGLNCKTITAAQGIDVYDSLANGGTAYSGNFTITATGPSGNGGTYTPGRCVGFSQPFNTTTTINLPFCAKEVPASMLLSSWDPNIAGNITITSVTPQSVTYQISGSPGFPPGTPDISFAFFWNSSF
jgi:hypothetical protein